ncbi:hypothetical protein [Mobiluncus mulieris]|uniref:hypothetical protein n=1 Tax=Mobiluncus mulieris TaxID=2052 RepID=UPI000E044054|nr:hypothetical protein [Mobiluncus mulieris]STY84186.1 Uncharacterised protein [Mobiluncus mulieris]
MLVILNTMVKGASSASPAASSLPTVKPPIALGVMNREQLDAVLAEGMASKATGSYLTPEEVKRKLAVEFSL